ncbi:hypothetical protein ACEPAF_564 [Sanghuangporus sanghuang]
MAVIRIDGPEPSFDEHPHLAVASYHSSPDSVIGYESYETFPRLHSHSARTRSAFGLALLPFVHNAQRPPRAEVKPESTRFPEPRLSWTGTRVPETTIVAHTPGWTALDKLYVFNGTMFVVTSTPEEIPEPKLLTSSGYEIFNGPVERAKRKPSEKDIRIVTPEEARVIFGTQSAIRLDGVSFMNTDPKQFIKHYYESSHWAAELFFGFWRGYSSLDIFITADGQTSLPPPRRMIFRHVSTTEWRDYASMNQWVTRGAFPSLSMEFKEDWADRAAMQVPFVFDRVLLADRASAGEGEPFLITWRSASNAFVLPGSQQWWSPIRRSVLEFSGAEAQWIYGPNPNGTAEYEKFVITYISRQKWGRRMLRQADHEKLVEELYKLRDKYGYEVNVVNMDKLTRAEQIQLAGRTTIMMGVHGNGLTSLLWMRPTRRATLIEFFYPGGVAFDYEFTTRALGMKHYGVWNNETFTRPNISSFPIYPEGFQGNDIPLNGTVVAQLVQDRLTLKPEPSTDTS